MGKKNLAVILTEACDWSFLRQLVSLSECVDVNVITNATTRSLMNLAFEELPITVYEIKDYKTEPSYLPGIESVLNGFDVVILTNMSALVSYQALRLRRSARFRLVVLAQNLKTTMWEHNKNARMIQKELAKVADEFWVFDDAVGSMLISEGTPKRKVVKIRPAKRTDDSNLERSGATVKAERIYVGYFGRLDWDVAILDFINSIKLAKSKYPEVAKKLKFLISGQGGLSQFVANRCELLGLHADVLFADPFGFGANQAYELCDAIYYTPRESNLYLEESAPLLFNAMADGKVVLASRSPATDEYLGKHRLDFTRASMPSMAKALFKLCTAKQLTNDICKKNLMKLKQWEDRPNLSSQVQVVLNRSSTIHETSQDLEIKELIQLAETRVSEREYFEAVNLIETLFANKNVSSIQKANLYRLMGDCFTQLADYDRALDCYGKSISLDEFTPKPYIGLGTIQILLERPELALIHFQKSVSLAPDNERANQGLGLTFQVLGQNREALKWMLIAQKLSPLNLSNIYSLVKICHELKEYELAEKVVKDFLRERPNNYDLKYTLAGILFKRLALRESLEVVQELLKLDPGCERTIKLKNSIEQMMKQEHSSSIA